MTSNTSLTAGFNLHSIFMGIMNVSMLGMGLVMAGAVAGPHAATIGDFLWQSLLMVKSYAVAAITHLPIGLDMVSNALHGHLAPTSYAMGGMGLGAAHDMMHHHAM